MEEFTGVVRRDFEFYSSKDKCLTIYFTKKQELSMDNTDSTSLEGVNICQSYE